MNIIIEELYPENYPNRSKLELYNAYGKVYRHLGDTKNFEYFHSKAYSMEKSVHLSEMNSDNAVIKNTDALQALSLGQKSKALKNIDKETNINKSLGDDEGLISSLNNKGTIANWNGYSKEAIIYYYKALVLCYKANSKSKMISTLYNIGKYFRENLPSYQESLQYHMEGYKICMELYGNENTFETSYSCLGLAEAYFCLKKYQECIEFAEKGSTMLESLFKEVNGKDSLNQLGLFYYLCVKAFKSLNNPEHDQKLIYYLEKCIQVVKKIKNLTQIESNDELDLTTEMKIENLTKQLQSLGLR